MDRYSPARLLHVAPRAHFFWPRGWTASMSPDRFDLLEIANTGMGREAPVGLPVAGALLGLWFLSPAVAWWLSRELAPAPIGLTGEQRLFRTDGGGAS